MFSKEQIELMKSIGLDINFEKPSDDDWFDIEDRVGDYLTTNGFDKDYKPNKKGWVCESIIDLIPR